MRYLLIIFAIAVSFQTLAQITVPTTTQSMYATVEATWCGWCGQYAFDANDDVISSTSPKAVYFVLHKSGTSSLYNSVAEDLANEMSTSGQPVFTWNGEVIGAYSVQNITNIKDSINAFYSSTGASVNTGFNWAASLDSIYIETKTTFFSTLSGNYNLAVYVYEDSIWAYQANYGTGGPGYVWHNHVLRASMNGSFGEQIATGTTTAGTSIDRNYTLALDPAWNIANLHIVAVLWQNITGDYVFVNANDHGGVMEGSSVNEETLTGFEVYPNPSNGILTIDAAEPGSVFIYDLTGKLVTQAQKNHEPLKVNIDLPGTYVVEFQTNNEQTIRKRVQVL